MSEKMVMFVSKQHQQTVKRLYKIIFRLHKSLPGELKQIGDSYVRHEFKLHKNANPEQTSLFMNEWANYVQILMKQVNPKFKQKIGQDLGESKLNNFNENQVRQLYELFKETTGYKQ
ncbi:unnamed protein product [Brachionus calyciflorus]|uniref:Succinate dehydrogenase assembly factor 3 n=1 Tax=Brachionus calyciflorus TaxID=104777 RepID=A0A813R1I0_9BILA|nr:unnamed protein product [Brachionus calyciflorus]